MKNARSLTDGEFLAREAVKLMTSYFGFGSVWKQFEEKDRRHIERILANRMTKALAKLKSRAHFGEGV